MITERQRIDQGPLRIHVTFGNVTVGRANPERGQPARGQYEPPCWFQATHGSPYAAAM